MTSGRLEPGDDEPARRAGDDADRLPPGARVGVTVLLVTAFVAGLAAIAAQALINGTDLGVRLPAAVEVRERLPQRVAPTPGGNEPTTPTNRASQAREVDIEDARALLQRHSAAVEAGDREAFLATIDPESPDYRAVAERTFNNLAALPIRAYRFGALTPDAGALTPDRAEELGRSAWVGDVVVELQFEGSDAGWWSTAHRLAFVRRDGELYIAGDAEGLGSSEPRPLWLLDEVRSVSGEHSLVIGTGSEDRLAAVADALDTGVLEVSAVWPAHWPEHVVVIMPDTQAQMERVIGARAGSQAKVAAVTTSVGRHSRDGGSHIVINPETFEAIGVRSQQVVLTHEAVHVATEATVSNVPIWLSEGFADYIGFKSSDLAIETVARGLLEEVRTDGPPDELPNSAAFHPRQPDLDRAYEAAWLACRYIAETAGEETLVEFYRAMGEVHSEDDEVRVYRDVLGHTPESFVRAWQDFLVERAAG